MNLSRILRLIGILIKRILMISFPFKRILLARISKKILIFKHQTIIIINNEF